MDDILKQIKLICDNIHLPDIHNEILSLHIPEKIFSKLKPNDLKHYTENGPFNYGYINDVQIVFDKFLSDNIVLVVYKDYHIEKIKITYE